MAYFAELDTNNIVIQVIIIDDEDILNDSGEQSEEIGQSICNSISENDNIWKQTHFPDDTGNILKRKNYAGIGFSYNESLDAFIPPQPFISWTLDEIICNWESPLPCPEGEEKWLWNESTVSWDEIEEI
jgi:hypothetical protein